MNFTIPMCTRSHIPWDPGAVAEPPRPVVVPWVITVSSSPGKANPTFLYESDGWTHLQTNLANYSEISDLGFLTPRGCQLVWDSCGDDYATRDLFVDVCARGADWLPCVVLGIEPTVDTHRVYTEFRDIYDQVVPF